MVDFQLRSEVPDLEHAITLNQNRQQLQNSNPSLVQSQSYGYGVIRLFLGQTNSKGMFLSMCETGSHDFSIVGGAKKRGKMRQP